MNESYINEIRWRMRQRPSLTQVAREAGLTYSWVCKFADGRINNPTVRTVTRLLHYLDTAERHKPAPSSSDQAA